MIGTMNVVGISHLTHNQVVTGSSPVGPSRTTVRSYWSKIKSFPLSYEEWMALSGIELSNLLIRQSPSSQKDERRRERELNLTPQYSHFQLIKRTLLSKSTKGKPSLTSKKDNTHKNLTQF